MRQCHRQVPARPLRPGADGQITRTLHGPSRRYREIVGVRKHEGWLYLSSRPETAAGRVPVVG